MLKSIIMKRYELLPHTGDIAILVRGKTLEDVFINSAYALFDIMIEVERVSEKETVSLTVEGDSLDVLLRNFLGELLYLFSAKGKAFCRFDVKLEGETKIKAVVFGEDFDLHKHILKTEIKAVTYHQLYVKKLESNVGWEAQVVFDV